MAHVREAGGRGDVAEAPVPIILEHHIATANRGHVQVGVAIVVDVRERRGHADLARHRDSGLSGDVLKPAAPEILPELIAADLADEVNVEESIPVDVRYRDAVSVVVVSRLVRLSGIVDYPMFECNPAGRESIDELEIVKSRHAGHGLGLLVCQPTKPRHLAHVVWNVTDGCGGGSGLTRGRSRACLCARKECRARGASDYEYKEDRHPS